MRFWSALAALGASLLLLVGCDDEPSGPDCSHVVSPCDEANENRCSTDRTEVEECSAGFDGCLAWTNLYTCADDEFCNDDDGEPSCSDCADNCEGEGSTRCDDDVVQTCGEGASGCLEWIDGEDCAELDSTCAEDGDEASCVAGCEDACDSDGDTRCDGEIVQVCETGGDDCLAWSDDTNCEANDPPQFCDDTGADAICSDSCADNCDDEDALQCMGDVIEVCAADDAGCLDWAEQTDCSLAEPAETCSDESGTPACVLGCSDECTGMSDSRCNGEVVEHCEVGTSACWEWVTDEDCSISVPPMVCDDVGDAMCRLDCIDECTFRGATGCDGDLLEVCVDGDVGCFVWSSDSDCSLLSPVMVCDERDGPERAECSLEVGVADSCASALDLTLPASISGSSFSLDFTDQLTMSGAGCVGTPREDEAVFTVALAAGETLVASNVSTGGGSAVFNINIQATCGEALDCLVSVWADLAESARYTATSDEIVTVIFETDRIAWGDYSLYLDIAEPEVCGDGVDNDLDGAVDCSDSDCFGIAPCNVERFCSDGLDNDADGTMDCADSDCVTLPDCRLIQGIFEFFETPPGDAADVAGWTITFIPDASAANGYTWSVSDGVTDFVVPPGLGTVSTVLTLRDDDSVEYALASMGSFAFYEQTYTSMFIGSNGFITFGEADTTYMPNVLEFFESPRIAGFWRDLNPSTDGRVTVDETTDQLVVTFVDVPPFSGSELYDFQMILNADGSIQLVYPDVPRDTGLVGIGSGVGLEPRPSEVDFVDVPEICDDAVDNDGDTLVDCGDPDCSGLAGCPSETDCRNGVDDDGDTLTDCADDECIDDASCFPEADCADGIDNDFDGLTDCADRDCFGIPPCDVEVDCDDRRDNDADGMTDCVDPDCTAADPRCTPESDCGDGADNDLDGLTDCSDRDCFGIAPCDVESLCNDGLDNDADGTTDCADVDCAAEPTCVPEADCADGFDNDLDGQTDCSDSDCFGIAPCDVETLCVDGLDNDGDGTTDCDDSDCTTDPRCSPEVDCADGADNDLDGWIDCSDSDCFGIAPCDVETLCTDGFDNDADGAVDCDDADCSPLPVCEAFLGIWQSWNPANTIDMVGHSLIFTPDAAAPNGYIWSVVVAATLPETAGGGTLTTELPLSDDDSQLYNLDVATMGSFPFYGVDYPSLYVGSNGVISFIGPLTTLSPSVDILHNQPVIAMLWDDLNPNDAAASPVVVDEYADRVVVTFAAVPRYGGVLPNTFQAILSSDGTIEIVWLAIDLSDAGDTFVGIVDGHAGSVPLSREVDFLP